MTGLTLPFPTILEALVVLLDLHCLCLTHYQAANKMEKAVKKVKLYKKAYFGLDLEVLGTSRAVKYAGSMLYAENVGVV